MRGPSIRAALVHVPALVVDAELLLGVSAKNAAAGGDTGRLFFCGFPNIQWISPGYPSLLICSANPTNLTLSDVLALASTRPDPRVLVRREVVQQRVFVWETIMTDIEMDLEVETEEFAQELSDEALDREGARMCGCLSAGNW